MSVRDEQMQDPRGQSLCTEDLALARKAGASPKAAEVLLRRLTPRIRYTVFLVMGSDPEAADLVQECMLAVFESLPRYRGTGSLEGWAGRISYRIIMRYLKKRRRSEATLDRRSDLHPSTEPGPDTLSERGVVNDKLRQHIEKLSLNKRMALILHTVHGYTVAEVAEITEARVNTVRDRLRVALRELRSSLASDPEASELFQGGEYARG